MVVEKCDQCQEPGRLGSDIRAYSFATAKGRSVIRLLHASDGGRRCYAEYEQRYRAWLDEQRKKASNG